MKKESIDEVMLFCVCVRVSHTTNEPIKRERSDGGSFLFFPDSRLFLCVCT